MNALSALLPILLLAAPMQATAQPPAPAAKAAPAKEAEPDLATLRAMKSRVFMVQHRDPIALIRILRPLGSGANGSVLTYNNEGGLNSLSARDFPENIAAIEEALKRLDVPSAPHQVSDVELSLQVLIASRTPVPDAGLPTDVQEVVKQLRNTLAYRGYTLAASLIQRVGVNGDRTIQGRGQLDSSTLPSTDPKDPGQLFVDWESDRGVSLEAGEGGSTRYVLRKFQFWLREKHGTTTENLARMETGITLKEGEKVVVGTSVVKDRGIIVVLTARRMN